MSEERGVPHGPERPDVDWFLSGKIETEGKLENYVSSPLHPAGRHKARLWSSILGLQQGDGRVLERLIREQLPQVEEIKERPAIPSY